MERTWVIDCPGIPTRPLWECPECGAVYTDAEARQQYRKCWRHPGFLNDIREPGVRLKHK